MTITTAYPQKRTFQTWPSEQQAIVSELRKDPIPIKIHVHLPNEA